MNERILEIIRVKGIKASRFAEMIGVQRSAISHLVSGRNKPSLEFLQKVLNRFPDINPQWLYSGTGNMLIDKTDPVPVPEKMSVSEKVMVSGAENNGEETNLVEEKPKKEVKSRIRKTDLGGDQKEIEKIVIFYTDRSFREFHPE